MTTLQTGYTEGSLKTYATAEGARRAARKEARADMGRLYDVYSYDGGYIVLSSQWRGDDEAIDQEFPVAARPSLYEQMVSGLKFVDA